MKTGLKRAQESIRAIVSAFAGIPGDVVVTHRDTDSGCDLELTVRIPACRYRVDTTDRTNTAHTAEAFAHFFDMTVAWILGKDENVLSVINTIKVTPGPSDDEDAFHAAVPSLCDISLARFNSVTVMPLWTPESPGPRFQVGHVCVARLADDEDDDEAEGENEDHCIVAGEPFMLRDGSGPIDPSEEKAVYAGNLVADAVIESLKQRQEDRFATNKTAREFVVKNMSPAEFAEHLKFVTGVAVRRADPFGPYTVGVQEAHAEVQAAVDGMEATGKAAAAAGNGLRGFSAKGVDDR